MLSDQTRAYSCRSFERDDQLFFGIERDRVDLQAAVGVARRAARTDVEAACMERAHKCPLAQNAVSQRSAPVRTSRLRGEDGSVAASKYRDRHALHLKQSPLSHRNAVDASEIRSDRQLQRRTH